MTDLKALSDAATQGVWRTYSLDQSTQILSETYVGETRDYHGDDATFITALVNAYRAGTIGATAAAEAKGYERGLREAADECGNYAARDYLQATRIVRAIAKDIASAILAKLETPDEQ